MAARLVLASASPRRHELLNSLGLPFEVIPSGVDENADPDLDPAAMAQRLARAKALSVTMQLPAGTVVIGADTTVVLGGTPFGKPTDAADAARMLRLLRGKTHDVISGVAVTQAGTDRVVAGAVTTRVEMADYTDRQIAEYVASGEPLDKAGSYAIQGRGGALVAGIEGCYNNVVGLPLCEAAALLAVFGVVPPVAPPVCRLPSGAACPRLRPERSP